MNVQKHWIFLLLTLFFIADLTACSKIEPGHVGIKNFMGNLREGHLDNGLHFTGLAQVISVTLQSQTFELEVTHDSSQAAVTSDMQNVGFEINLAYYVPSGEAANNLIRFVNRNPDRWLYEIISPAIEQSVKTVFATRTLREIVEQRETVRLRISAEIQRLVDERLSERDPVLLGALLLTQVNLSNLEYDEELQDIINETVRQQQRQLQAQNEVERQLIELQAQVQAASAERQSQVELSQGRAESMMIEAQAIAERRELQAIAEASFYTALAEAGVDVNAYIYIQRWSGNLPEVMTGGEDNPALLLPVNNSGQP